MARETGAYNSRGMASRVGSLLPVTAKSVSWELFRGCVKSHLDAILWIIWVQAAMVMKASDVCTRYS